MRVSIGITIGHIILLGPESKHRSTVCMHHLLNCLIEQLRDGLKILICCGHRTPFIWISNRHGKEPWLMRSLPCLSSQQSSIVDSLRLEAFTISGGDPDDESLLRIAGTCIVIFAVYNGIRGIPGEAAALSSLLVSLSIGIILLVWGIRSLVQDTNPSQIRK